MKVDIGAGLLPADFGNNRANVLMRMSCAYRSILSEKTENMGLWMHTRNHTTKLLQERHAKAGLTAPPLNLAALWARVNLPGPGDANAHMRLVEALLTDFGPILSEHIRYRMRNHGNIHLEFSGPTGMGKSSCAIALADWVNEIEPTKLQDHLSFDLGDLPVKLKGKTAGQTVVQDEYVQLAGEGARTHQSLFANLEDTLRASQVNLFVLSPRRQDHGTMQARLELISWNPVRCFSAFLVWLEDQPHGVVALPWARKELWDAYAPWKQANVERSVAGQFKDNAFAARAAMRVCQDERFVEYMVACANKPKKIDFQSALELFSPQMLATTQSERIVNFLHVAAYSYERIKTRFHDLFGIEANDGFRRVAAKCTTRS